MNINNPKRNVKSRLGRAGWFPYYAGFSEDFAYDVIGTAGLKKQACVLDPWNGSGTTSSAATQLGFTAYGYDLNPVMAIIAKARLLNRGEFPSISPLTADIVKKAYLADTKLSKDDPLCTWFIPSSAREIRRIEIGIQTLLVDDSTYIPIKQRILNQDNISDLAAFFYTALFRVIRSYIGKFTTSNPTWVKLPPHLNFRLRPHLDSILSKFKEEVQVMISSAENYLFDNNNLNQAAVIGVASSDLIPRPDNSADFILTSPPYCTRIDYAVATMPELAVLGYTIEGEVQQLRRNLIGTSTVSTMPLTPSIEWGQTCTEFLGRLQSHESKASKSYYYKNHLQYFNSIYLSLGEISRLLMPGGKGMIVVQDSYYKDIHNNLPQVFIEMALSHGLELERRVDFRQRRTMAGINPAVKPYRSTASAVESVLCFTQV
jgi:hypothetical protein